MMSDMNDEQNYPEKGPNEERGRSEEENQPEENEETIHDVTPISGMYQEYFLDYASYVILERAVPSLKDGLKPVQRRILHAMRQMHDGRYHKVANIIGEAMKYHPHGDAAIGDALVNLGQKGLMLDTQGNWGDIRTGDSAAAPRYIEARLSQFALEVAFNHKTTEWQLSYDGRNSEPVNLPMKFPLILAQGIEGIAVGLATKVMPHNFCELINASIRELKGQSFELYPDFPTGGLMDVAQYNDGKKGGRIRLRAKIEEDDRKTLAIRDIPYTTTTDSLIETIIKANDQGKIKIKKVVDNTAAQIEILVYLPKGADPDVTIDALYAFTDCEISIAPNACVIVGEKPTFMSVTDILRQSTQNTLNLLDQELRIKLGELQEKWHFSSLEKIFIEERIYRRIEECETWEAVLETIDTGLEPYKEQLVREVTHDDIIRLTEIKIKRISKYDSFKADEQIRKLEEDIESTKYNIEHLTDYAIQYFEYLLAQYGEGKERQTEIRSFESIDVREVAAANQKLYVNRSEGFVGTGLKKDEYVGECSEVDDLIVFLRNGQYMVTKVADKVFVGKDIIYVAIWKRGDERTVYNAMYVDGKTAVTRGKRFHVKSVTRDRVYDVTKGNEKSRLVYFSANPNGETEKVRVHLTANTKAKKKSLDFDFGDIDIKSREAQGNIVTKYTVKKVLFLEKGGSSLGGIQIWYDPETGRLNRDERGDPLGKFDARDQILVFYKEGTYELTSHELTNRYSPDRVVHIERYDSNRVITAIYYDGEHQCYYVKRFQLETSTQDKEFNFISDHKESHLYTVNTHAHPQISLTTKNKKQKETKEFDLTEFVDIRGWKAVGNKLSDKNLQEITFISEPEAPEEGAEEPINEQAEENPNESSEEPTNENSNETPSDTDSEDNQMRLF